ncbi:hypothetical protein CVT24_010577 [Panaeolus cyanescens]|uniref:Uncharacterized protein n=1 Tax=Panaeolus cyanescens TaxID=181874 RepID=A0A409YVU8_9AGAR|nr:hypothetical protein CVT24_010577 [Panaeolus cyanescens]
MCTPSFSWTTQGFRRAMTCYGNITSPLFNVSKSQVLLCQSSTPLIQMCIYLRLFLIPNHPLLILVHTSSNFKATHSPSNSDNPNDPNWETFTCAYKEQRRMTFNSKRDSGAQAHRRIQSIPTALRSSLSRWTASTLIVKNTNNSMSDSDVQLSLIQTLPPSHSFPNFLQLYNTHCIVIIVVNPIFSNVDKASRPASKSTSKKIMSVGTD